MQGISISVVELLFKGVPEGLLIMLALHFFTRTKINVKKYLMLSAAYIIITYLIRFLPITLGVNTMLSLLTMILLFQLAYNAQLSKVVSSIVSSVIMMTLIMISELINIFLLIMFYGEVKTEILLNSTGMIKSISTIPSTVFFAILIFTGYFILKNFDKRKKEYGEAGKETGE